ncbi:MAG: sulfotransferase [Bryobacteraceae bacterium]|nr:sulfotransferase [Bryobacteraceae bacterium]
MLAPAADSVSPTLHPLRRAFAGLPHPVVIFNKSHSGSRMLAELVAAGGVFLGAHRNESWDSLDLLELVTRLVCDYYPDYGPLWDPARPPDAPLSDLAARVFENHLEGFARDAGGPWGWKLCETVYILPVLDYCFPRARYLHLVRDGRDVAFSDHHGPSDPFWRKVYFNTDRIRTFQGRRLTGPAYRRDSPLYNALHWTNSVAVGRNFGMMLRERYLEIRYEDLCSRFDETARRALDFIGAPDPETALSAMRPGIYRSSVAKHRLQPARRVRDVVAVMKPLLLSLGYLDQDPEPPRWSLWRSDRMDRFLDRWRKRNATDEHR